MRYKIERQVLVPESMKMRKVSGGLPYYLNAAEKLYDFKYHAHQPGQCKAGEVKREKENMI